MILTKNRAGGIKFPEFRLHYKLTVNKVKVKSLSRVQFFVIPSTIAYQVPLSMDSPGKNTEVGSHSLLQGIFPTQGFNPGLLYCRQIL